MRQILPYQFWIGHVGDARNLRGVLDLGIRALVDLAANELPVEVTRELVYRRFPLLDGAGNASWLLHSAIETVAKLIERQVPSLVFCSLGMSRSPAIVAAGLSLAIEKPIIECLKLVTIEGPHDVSPGLWQDVVGVIGEACHGIVSPPNK